MKGVIMNLFKQRVSPILYLLILITTILATNRKNYLIEHDKGIDPLAGLDPTKTMDITREVIFTAELFEITFATLDLTTAELEQINGIVHNDETIDLTDTFDIDYSTEYSIDDPIIAPAEDSKDSNIIPRIYNFSITSDIPKCNASVNNNIRMIIIDSVFAPSVYLKHNVTLLHSFVGDEACPYFRHGSQVASVISEMIPHGSMEIQSIGVFNCDRKASAYSIIRGVELVIQEAKKHPGTKYIINFSGTGPVIPVLNQPFIEAERLGIATYVAAGNKQANCMGYSPAQAASFSSVSTIGSNCDYKPCSFTNYETPDNDQDKKCVTLNLPGCVDVTNAINGKRENICGTSFSTPIAAARHAIAQEYNPDLDNQEIKKLVLTAGVYSTTIPSGAHFGNGLWDVLDREYACPQQSTNRIIFSTPKTFYDSKLTTWYNATAADGKLCVRFTARFIKSTSLVIGARVNGLDNPIARFKLDTKTKNPKRNKKYKHTLDKVISKTKTKNLAVSVTKNRVVISSYREYQLEQQNNTLLLQYRSENKQMSTLMAGKLNRQLGQIAFAGDKARVKNARLCFTG